MIQYPNDYFKEEIRCGFRVTELMKRCWAAQLEVLAQIEKICNKYNLEYFAVGGSLIGAVRHKGFIPWDDDLDIAMKRKDYMVFMNVVSKEMPEEYEVLSIYNNPEWDNTFSRIVNSRKVPLKGERFEEFHRFPLLAGIDIFPMDYIPRDKELANTQNALLDLAWRMIANVLRYNAGYFRDDETELVSKELQEGLSILGEFCSVPSIKEYSLIQIFQLIYDQLCMFGTEENSDFCAFISSIRRGGFNVICKKQWFERFEYMSFEYGKIKIPSRYDDFLRVSFGNYMKYKKMTQGHEYPYYKEQIKILKEKNLWNYIEDPKDMGCEDEYVIPGSIHDIADEWVKRSCKAKEDGKRVVLFQPMLTSMLAYEEKYIDAIEVLIDNFIKNPRVLLWFRPHLNEHVPYADIRPELFEKYRDVCMKYQDESEIIFDISDNQQGANELCDVYVGDECPISEAFEESNKKHFAIDVKSNKLEQFVKNF